MKINTALILCAGFGKRLNPITLKTPKPLLKIKDLTLLEHCINLINKFIEENNFKIEIKVIEDGNSILNTGGGVLNLISKINEDNFLVFNPDTIWYNNY